MAIHNGFYLALVVVDVFRKHSFIRDFKTKINCFVCFLPKMSKKKSVPVTDWDRFSF